MHPKNNRCDQTESYEQIETDGRPMRTAGDSIDQHRVDIPLGNTRDEAYRLLTFRGLPISSSLNPTHLAAHGFYYTGIRDRVRCFSCGLPVEGWMPNDDVTSPQLHSSDCNFINGRFTNNVPILDSNGTWSRFRGVCSDWDTETSSAQTPPQSSMRPRSRRQANVLAQRPSTNPSSSSTSGLNQHQPNRSSSSVAVPRLSGYRNPNPISQPERRSVVSCPSNQSALFRCLHPFTPEMRSYDARLQTFLRNLDVWPQHRIRATPQDIAAAGMYYLGERDRTRCWYCNGALQNWDRDDDPWEEHAKWFPACEYVLQQKGREFVRAIEAQHPNLRRPVLQAPPRVSSALPHAPFAPPPALPPPASSAPPPALSPPASSAPPPSHTYTQLWPSSRSATSTARSSGGPEIVDPREELRLRNRTIEEEMASSGVVSRARQMGFEDNQIKAALIKQHALNNQGFSNLEALVEMILSLSEEDVSDEEASLPPITSMPSSSSASPSSATSDVLELESLEKSRRCQVCRRNLIQVVFLPCAHFVCCEECGREMDVCRICQTPISDRVVASRT